MPTPLCSVAAIAQDVPKPELSVQALHYALHVLFKAASRQRPLEELTANSISAATGIDPLSIVRLFHGSAFDMGDATKVVDFLGGTGVGLKTLAQGLQEIGLVTEYPSIFHNTLILLKM